MDLSSFVRRDISGIRKDILPLSGFGILSHALADEIAARNQTREGYFYTTDMEFLEEAEPEQPPMLPPRPRQPETIRMDMTLLFKIVQENQESGKALPAGTQKLLERVRTILQTSPQSRAISAPQAVRRVYVPLPQSAPSTQSTRLTPTILRQGAPQYLPWNRMQNPLRGPKAPLAVEKMQMPSREVPRASDHAMLFSDVLHRAQDSGLTFATRKGQGGLPASAQTRTAYTAQALRQAKAEQQAAEERSIPVWQRMMQKEASQTSTDVSGASWQFDETGSAQQKANEIAINNALRAEELTPMLPAQKMPENAAGVLQRMAAPRYPEAELNFAQEEALTEGAEVPVPTAQHPSTESIRAVQEASAKALTESVRSALKEAAPLMTATVQETVQKQERQTAPNIPLQSTAAVENRSGKAANAATPDTAFAFEKAQAQRMEIRHAEASRNAENSSAEDAATGTAKSAGHEQMQGGATENHARQENTEKTLPAEPKEASAIRTDKAEESPKVAQKPTTGFAERKAALEKTAEVFVQKAVKQSYRQDAKYTADTGREMGVEQISGAGYDEADPERIPVLSGDRAFAETPENAVSILQQMAAPRYPEAELNFAQEEAPTEGAEVPIPTAQHPSTESIRAMQEASAKALTESVRSALKEAVPLMTATVQETVQKQKQERQIAPNIPLQSTAAVENRAGKAVNAATPDTAFASEKAQAQRTETKHAVESRNAENSSAEDVATGTAKSAGHEQMQGGVTENPARQKNEEKTLLAEPKEASGSRTDEAEKSPKGTAGFAERKSAPQKTAEVSVQKAVEHSREKTEERAEISGNAEAPKMPERTAKQTQETVQEQTVEVTQGQLQFVNAEEKTEATVRGQSQNAKEEAATRETVTHPESSVLSRSQDAEHKAGAEYETGVEQTLDAEHEADVERIPALNGDRAFVEAPENAAGILQQMAAPRYPEAELNFAQEEALMEGAEVPTSTAQHPSTESIRAVQEASAKALTESVRSALKEAAPLMIATAQETVQKQERQAAPNIPLQSTAAVEKRAGKAVNVAKPDTAFASEKAQVRRTETKHTVASSNAENGSAENAATDTAKSAGHEQMQGGATENPARQKNEEKTLPAEPKEASAIRTDKAEESPKVAQKPTTGFAERKAALEKTAEVFVQKAVKQSHRQDAEHKAGAEYETGVEQTLDTEHEADAERIPALNGDRAFAEAPENEAGVLQRMAAPRYPEAELNFAQEEAPTEGAEMPIPTAQHPSTESIRAMQEASAKALTESVRSALKEVAPLMTATVQETVQKQAEQAVQSAVTAVLEEKTAQSGTSAQNRLTQKVTEAVNRSIDTALKQSAPQVQQAVQTQEKEKIRELHQTLRQEAAETLQQAVSGSRNETTAAQKNRAIQGEQMARQENRVPQNMPGTLDVRDSGAAENAERRLPPLPGGQTLPGQTAGMERAVELLRQKGYGSTPLEYRMEDAAPETTAMQMLSTKQTGTAAEKSLLWLGERVAANAARELSRMQRTMPNQQNSTVHPGQLSRQDRPGQPGNTGNVGCVADAQNAASAGKAGTPYTAGRMTAQTLHPTALHTAARPMGIPAEAQWRPGGQAAPAQMVSPAEMPQLMYQTGQSEGTEAPFAPVGSAKHALPQLGNSMEAQSTYPALSMEYSSPMSRMEQQLQSAMAQQMSAASRPMAMQTEAGQYMAGKAAPGGMTTLDQMSAPPVNDQIVWQNPYLRSAPADMTYRNKKKPVEQQPQPAPRPQAVRMSDAEIHRMADQVFRIVKDKIRQERRKMGL